MLYKELPNGLTVILKNEPNLNNAVINIFIQRGSSAETKEKTGMAHFLEHMMFEGSRNYPDFDLTLQKLLAENNAFTSQDYTNYYELVPNKHINAILQIERNRFEHLNWDKKKFQLQQSIILEEFKETSINPPLSDSWHYLLKLCFNNSYHWPVIGSKLSHIKDFTMTDIKTFYKKNYSADKIIVSIISNLPDQKALRLVEQNFETLQRKKTIKPPIAKNAKKTGKSKIVRRKNISS
jgi:zinc protease